MNYFTLLLCILTLNLNFAQSNQKERRGLYFEHTEGFEKTIRIKEYKKVKISTISGEEFSGRYSILSDSTIMVQDKIIPLNDIVSLSTKTKGIQFFRGSVVVAASAVNLWGVFVLAYFGTILPEHLIVLAADIILVAVLIGTKDGKKIANREWGIRIVE